MKCARILKLMIQKQHWEITTCDLEIADIIIIMELSNEMKRHAAPAINL